ncbi:hypothetical protein R0K18_32185 [Pantoea sp. SIMBA_133]
MIGFRPFLCTALAKPGFFQLVMPEFAAFARWRIVDNVRLTGCQFLLISCVLLQPGIIPEPVALNIYVFAIGP